MENKKYYEIDENLAEASKRANSFSDYQINSATNSYKSAVDSFNASIEKLKKTNPENYKSDKDRIDYLQSSYARKLATAINTRNRIDASVPSVMITGAGNFPVKRKEKQNNARDNWYKQYGNLFGDENYMYNKIEGIITNKAIYANENNAVGKLKQKLCRLEEAQQKMKLQNAYYRKNKSMKGYTGLSNAQAEALDTAINKTYYKKPHASFELSNNLASINQVKTRISNLGKAKNSERSYKKVSGINVVENKDLMRIQLFFDSKPDENTRDLLKKNGFKWSPTQSAWQRQITSNGQRATNKILNELGESQHKPESVKSFKDLESKKNKTRAKKKTAKIAVLTPFELGQIDSIEDLESVYRPYFKTKSGKVIYAKNYGLKAFKFRD